MFKRIAVVGVGLIGGSFALAARRAKLAQEITGWDYPDQLDSALSLGIIDSVESSFQQNEPCRAGLVYLAPPVGQIIEFLKTKGGLIERGAIVTDAGSTKREICRQAESLPPGVHFVGGHPMAGSHRGGIARANAGLLQGCPYALIKQSTGTPALDAMESIVHAVGANPVLMSADEHDAAAAAISHCPQFLSTALALSVSEASGTGSALDLAGPGFGDMVRLAASPWPMWESICLTNADNISRALGEVAAHVEMLRQAIQSGALDQVEHSFREATHFTQGFLARRNGGDTSAPDE